MNGPFQSQKGGEAIAKFTKDELFPTTKKIRELAISVSQFKSDFFESFLRFKLNALEKSFKNTSIHLLSTYHKWSTPDELFKNADIDPNKPEEFGPVMQDYFNSQQAIMQHFNEAFRLSSYIDGTLTGQRTASYNRTSIGLSILAITISIILTIIFKK